MKKLKSLTKERIRRVQNFLETEIGSMGILVDSDYLIMYQVMGLYYNATGIYFKGKNNHSESVKDRIEEKEFNRIYFEMKRQDEDFRIYLIESYYSEE
jgi:hypothetical protein